MSKSYKYSSDTEQRNKQSAKRTKLSKQEQGRIEKALLRQGALPESCILSVKLIANFAE